MAVMEKTEVLVVVAKVIMDQVVLVHMVAVAQVHMTVIQAKAMAVTAVYMAVVVLDVQVEQDVTENTPLMVQMREDMLAMELLLKVARDKIP